MSPDQSKKGTREGLYQTYKKSKSFNISELIKNTDDEPERRSRSQQQESVSESNEVINLSVKTKSEPPSLGDYNNNSRQLCNSRESTSSPSSSNYATHQISKARDFVSPGSQSATSPADSGYGSESPSPQQSYVNTSAIMSKGVRVKGPLHAEFNWSRQQEKAFEISRSFGGQNPEMLYRNLNSHFLARSQALAMNTLLNGQKIIDRNYKERNNLGVFDFNAVANLNKKFQLFHMRKAATVGIDSQEPVAEVATSQEEAVNLTISKQEIERRILAHEEKQRLLNYDGHPALLPSQNPFTGFTSSSSSTTHRPNFDYVPQFDPAALLCPRIPPFLPPVYIEPCLNALYAERWRQIFASCLNGIDVKNELEPRTQSRESKPTSPTKSSYSPQFRSPSIASSHSPEHYNSSFLKRYFCHSLFQCHIYHKC